MKVFAFDRDRTVDVNPPRGRRSVPLEWVTHLAHATEHEVWAIGNQRLKQEADIPGVAEAIERQPNLSGAPQAAVRYERDRRVRMVGALFPEAETYIVVDDVNLKHLDGWIHYFPWDFVTAVETGDLDITVSRHSMVSRPDRGPPSASRLLTWLKEWLLG